MKNLISLEEFKKKNPKGCLDSNQLNFISDLF